MANRRARPIPILCFCLIFLRSIYRIHKICQDLDDNINTTLSLFLKKYKRHLPPSEHQLIYEENSGFSMNVVIVRPYHPRRYKPSSILIWICSIWSTVALTHSSSESTNSTCQCGHLSVLVLRSVLAEMTYQRLQRSKGSSEIDSFNI